MALLTKDQILAAKDLDSEDVEVPEWGGTVRVQGLAGEDRDLFETSIVQRNGKKVETNWKNIRARLVSLSVVDEEGKRIFTEVDVNALGRKSAAALTRVFEVAQRLSGLQAEDVDELAANLPPEDGAASSSI